MDEHTVAASHSPNVVLMGDYNHSVFCWRDNAAGHQKSKRFPKSIGDNFLFQVVHEPTRSSAMLNFVLTNKENGE